MKIWDPFGIQDIKNTIQEKDMKDSPEWRWREILRLMIEKVTSPCWYNWEDSGRDESKKMKSVDYLMFLNLLKGKEIYTVGEKLWGCHKYTEHQINKTKKRYSMDNEKL